MNWSTKQRGPLRRCVFVAKVGYSPIIGVLFLLLFFVSPEPAKADITHAPVQSEQNLLPPPRAGLLPIHRPSLEGLEPAVREQLSSFWRSLTTLAQDRDASDRNLSEAYALMGQLCHAYSLTEPAEACYLNAHRLDPRDFRWAHLLGNLYERQARPDQAITYYQLVRRLRPDYLAAAVNIGNLYLQQNRLDEARTSFNEALRIDPKCSAARYGLGQAALSARSYAEAVAYLEQAAAETPDATRIHYALGMAYRGLGNVEKARKHLERQGSVGVRVADPLVDGLHELIQGERLHLVRGRLAFDFGRFSEAAGEFRKALAANPGSVTARMNLGSSLARLGDATGAGEHFTEILRVDPRNSRAHYNLGLLYATQNQHERAIRHLTFALDSEPNDIEARLLLARELVKAERAEEALTEFTRMVEADPGNEDALLDQVDLLLKSKQFDRAVEALEKGHALFPQKGQTAAVLAYLLAASPQLELRNGSRALELARRVYQATGQINHGAIVAMALAELGRCSEAAEWQRRMLSAAERESRKDLVDKLKADLLRYETARPCRPQASR